MLLAALAFAAPLSWERAVDLAPELATLASAPPALDLATLPARVTLYGDLSRLREGEECEAITLARVDDELVARVPGAGTCACTATPGPGSATTAMIRRCSSIERWHVVPAWTKPLRGGCEEVPPEGVAD